MIPFSDFQIVTGAIGLWLIALWTVVRVYRNLTDEGKRALLSSFYELALVSSPVVIYVAIEAWHDGKWLHLLTSPEWSIVTIFLAFQALSLYSQGVSSTGRLKAWAPLGSMGGLAIIVAASFNVAQSIEHNTAGAIAFRSSLFSFAVVWFVVIVTSGKLAEYRAESKRRG